MTKNIKQNMRERTKMKAWVPRIREEGRRTSSSWKLPRQELARQTDLHRGWVLPTRPHSDIPSVTKLPQDGTGGLRAHPGTKVTHLPGLIRPSPVSLKPLKRGWGPMGWETCVSSNVLSPQIPLVRDDCSPGPVVQ